MSFDPGGDLCLGFWAQAWDAGVIHVPSDAHVLEIGSAEADWIGPMRRTCPGWTIDGIDWRGGPGTIRADVLTHDFPPASCDLIVAISTLEHIGLGGYSDDPQDPDGDTKAVRRAVSWLKPGGYLYFDVPFRPTGPYEVRSKFRAYDPPALKARLLPDDLAIVWEQLFTPSHPDAPYLAVVTQKV